MPVKQSVSTTSRARYQGPRTNQSTTVHIHVQTCLILDFFSTLTRAICYGSSRPDPHETRTSRVTRSVAGRVGSGQQGFISRGLGRVGSGGAHTTREKKHLKKKRTNNPQKKPKHSTTTFAQFMRKPQTTYSVIPHCRFTFVHVCNSLISHEHASRIQQDLLVWRHNPAAIPEHTHWTTTKQDNRLMRPKPDRTNDPTIVSNAKICARHKHLLVHETSTHVPLYSKLEHRVLLLIGWPVSRFFQVEKILNSSLGIHRNAQSDRLSYCSSLVIRNKTDLPMKHANPSNAIIVFFCFHTTKQSTHSRHTYICT